jgi:hypothetical protein
MTINKGNNKITELRTILQRESQNSQVYKQTQSVNNRKTVKTVLVTYFHWWYKDNTLGICRFSTYHATLRSKKAKNGWPRIRIICRGVVTCLSECCFSELAQQIFLSMCDVKLSLTFTSLSLVLTVFITILEQNRKNSCQKQHQTQWSKCQR